MTDPSTILYVTLALIGIMTLAIAIVWWSDKKRDAYKNELLLKIARAEERRMERQELLAKKSTFQRELSEGVQQLREEIDIPSLMRSAHRSRNDNIVDSDFIFSSSIHDSPSRSSGSSWSSNSSGVDSSSSWSSSSSSCGGGDGGGGAC